MPHRDAHDRWVFARALPQAKSDLLRKLVKVSTVIWNQELNIYKGERECPLKEQQLWSSEVRL